MSLIRHHVHSFAAGLCLPGSDPGLVSRQSRDYVLSWELSNSLEVGFCLEALDRALARSKPEIFNSDQGAQFTSRPFTGRLAAAGVRISMDDRGRVFDNIFIERLWRSVKYEDIYLKEYDSVPALVDGLDRYFR
ncbi:MAG: DDE-type integrase/transposase/recombinase, partial [Acidobacteria bacterium]|nr:DDE-type integrase/transposase/recombinase [Acidobacteriota bacterium]